MMNQLFIDKYVPQSFDKVFFNRKIAESLLLSAKSNDSPHLILNGPSGSGKKTFAFLYVQEKAGKTLNTWTQNIKIKYGNRALEIRMNCSDSHYVINPQIHGVYDRLIVQEFIKDILKNRPINHGSTGHHTIIIDHADMLTIEAQQSLRRTLEKFIKNCRFIFIVNQNNQLIDTLSSRCFHYRLSAPTKKEICSVLDYVAKKEGIILVPEKRDMIAEMSDRNMGRALNILQKLSLFHPSGTKSVEILDVCEIDSIERHLQIIYDRITGINFKSESQIKNLVKTAIPELREVVQKLMVHCVSPIQIIKRLFGMFITMDYGVNFRLDLIDCASQYEISTRMGSKSVYHIEGFLITVLLLCIQYSSPQDGIKSCSK